MNDRLRYAMDAVSAAEGRMRPVLEDQLRQAVAEDATIAADLRRWAGDWGCPVERTAAREAAVRTNHARYRVATGSAPPPSFRETPVAPFAGLPDPPAIRQEVRRLEAHLDGLDDVDAGLVGAGYAEALAEDERRRRGQFYTPAPVAELLVRWALDAAGERPRLLDPAAGTGAFPLAAVGGSAGRRSVQETPATGPTTVAVDVDGVALHVAGLRLSARGGPLDRLDARPRSFFELEPGRDVDRVDAVVGNPPFVRAGELHPDREHFRAHLESFGGAEESPYVAGERGLSRRSDASVYFVTHATRFLRPGGRLGVVLPAKWLESDYGVGFRRFLADQYDVRAVVGFDARAFDALVDTVLLLAERRAGPRTAGEDPDVRFVRLDGAPTADRVLEALRDGRVAGLSTGREVRRAHSAFAGASQCSPYLRAPGPLLDLLDHPDFVPLGDLADVHRGVTTGANRFFLLDDETRDRWGIDPALLRPALRSVRGFDERTFERDDAEHAVLDVHGVLEDRLASLGPDDDRPAAAKAALEAAGHAGVVDYIGHAEAEGWHEGRTCQSRPVWFDLGPLPTPDAFVPKLVRERVFTVRNRAGAVPSNAIDCLDVRERVDTSLLLGVLDSSVCRATMEVWGRDEAGLLQLMTFETRTLPIPDVRGFSDRSAAAVVRAADDLAVEGPDRPAAGQAALDEAVVSAVDVDLSADRVRKLRESLVRRRVDGGGRVEVPLG